ncbi:Zn-dependent exopeptidase [Eremomyces bilateralis CBS 781.70]|uniref:Peptide hydrolase n=1 Tax=Eremomyces bilateralis CBS 781.70 TaxID=1392243 RepID=A0A6G1FWJ2_9PEZI|nr:Zn-dependent exopeptidase [Eremomyces bilateralis CBS 781.70]KAF1810153.1 Zn-dependent exopeptidase [Eremomyces bilateralis CBS 781.70]
MFRQLGILALAATATFAQDVDNEGADVHAEFWKKPWASSKGLQHLVKEKSLLDCAQTLEDFAYATEGRNRLAGSKGHNDTVDFLYKELSKLNYYNVTLQPWSALIQESGDANFTLDGEKQSTSIFSYSPSGNATSPLVIVDNLGCEASDYPAELSGKIALISRGECEFGAKSVSAGLAGAVGAVIYNNVPGDLNGTLGVPSPDRPYVPTVGLSQEAGAAVIAKIQGGAEVIGELSTYSVIKETFTNNVLATTKGGDQDNILAVGAHSDSVAEGPGINDDGSGICGLLEVAKDLARFKTKNAVRFGWWSGEEEGLLGSTYYVATLSEPEAAKIKAYLNFDMIASPNYYYAIYDGDGSTFNLTGPPGSAELEHFFEDFYTKKGLNFTATEFDGRSDYGPFLDVGIASGGTFTGAEGIKTEEEAAQFGGEAGVPYDVNYHQAGDNVTNLALDAFEVNTKGIAAAVGTYSISFEGLNLNTTTVARRGAPAARLAKRWNKQLLKRNFDLQTARRRYADKKCGSKSHDYHLYK